MAGEPSHHLQPCLGCSPTARRGSERKKYVWWDAEVGTWTGADVPDFIADRAPDYEPPEGATDRTPSAARTRRHADRRQGLALRTARAGGRPDATHYEPPESPVPNPLYSQQNNPARQKLPGRLEPVNPSFSEVFPTCSPPTG